MSAALKHIAAIAKGLNKAELHVLIELAARAEAAGAHDAVASSRDLAERTGLVRASVQAAIDSLNAKAVLWSDAGAATRPATHRLIFLDAVEIEASGPMIRPGVAQKLGHGGLKSEPVVAQTLSQGGPVFGRVAAQTLSQGGPNFEPGVAQFSGQGGLNSGPLPNRESSICEPAHIDNASAPTESIEKNDFDRLIDRIQTSKKADFDEDVFEAARNLIASHHAKFAREGHQLPGKPDDQITAQFLAVAEWPQLSRILHDLLTERHQTSFSWGWYVTVALQRLHGISPDKARRIWAKLRNDCAPDTLPMTSSKAMTPYRNAFVPAHEKRLRGREQRMRPATDMNGLGNQLRALVTAKSMR